MRSRSLLSQLRTLATTSSLGRIIVLTGARQTGKTTLAQRGFPEYTYLSLEDPVTRPEYSALSAAQWRASYPVATLDEVQKAPSLIESVKAAYDAWPEVRYLLLGSSQILLLEKVRESLAGRAALVELYPLTLPEMLTEGWNNPVSESRFISWLRCGAETVFTGIPKAESDYVRSELAFRQYLQFGAMPAVAAGELSEPERYDWLSAYVRTYLQRDLRDLANLRDLTPFVRAQKSLSGLTGQTLNISELSRLSGITAPTAKRFIQYLDVSYQIILLEPWSRNLGKRLVKAPKLHFLDPGIQRSLLQRRGELTGAEYESAVVAEIFKQLKNSRLPVSCYHLRTADGREVDLLLELETGFVPIEIKQTARATANDARHLKRLEDILDKPVLHSLLVSNDPRIQRLADGVTALPAPWLLGISEKP